MKLEYEQIEDSFDDTTHLRTITEQAVIPDKGVLIRTVVYSPHHLAVSTAFIPGAGTHAEGFDAIS